LSQFNIWVTEAMGVKFLAVAMKIFLDEEIVFASQKFFCKWI